MDIRWKEHIIILYEQSKDLSIALAIKEHLESEFSSCDVVAIDSGAYNGEFRTKTRHALFRFTNKHFRRVIARISKKQDVFSAKRIATLMKTNGYSSVRDMKRKNPEMKRFLNIIKRFDPKMVISTTPDALRLMIIARELLGKTFKIVGAISDFALDLAFVRTEADGYFVENPTVKSELERNGIPSQRIAIIGYPTKYFNIEGSRTQKRIDFGLAGDLPLVTVYGGAYETRSIKEDILHLMKNHEDYILMIITQDITMKRFYMDNPDFNKSVMLGDTLTRELMDVTDVLVTVPDTGAIFDAFVRGIPVIVEPAITVLEKRIRKYLLSRHLIIPARTPDETLYGIREILLEPSRANEFKYRGLEYAKSSVKDMTNLTPKISNDGILKLDNTQETPNGDDDKGE